MEQITIKNPTEKALRTISEVNFFHIRYHIVESINESYLQIKDSDDKGFFEMAKISDKYGMISNISLVAGVGAMFYNPFAGISLGAVSIGCAVYSKHLKYTAIEKVEDDEVRKAISAEILKSIIYNNRETPDNYRSSLKEMMIYSSNIILEKELCGIEDFVTEKPRKSKALKYFTDGLNIDLYLPDLVLIE